MTYPFRVVSKSARTYEAILGNIDLGDAVTGLTIDVQAGEWPVVTLTLAINLVDIELEVPEFRIPQETIDLLEHLGWTPPVTHDRNP